MASAVLAAALVGDMVLLFTVFTWLQEVSARWMGLAGLALPVSLAMATVATVAVVLASAFGAPRRRRSVLLAAGLFASWATVAVLAAPTLRGIVAPRPAVDGVALSVVTQNLWYENEEPDVTARAVLARDADVMVLVEYTSAHAEAFRAAGARATYPYRWEEPGEVGGGLAVMSKVPFGDVDRLSTWSGAVRLDLEVEGVAATLYAVHPVAPSDKWGLLRWQGDYRTITDALEGAGPSTIVAGDFNATGSHRRFRELLTTGSLRDAPDVSGAGFGPTWPSGGWSPPVMRLDHVLVGSDIGVDRVEVLDDHGSDHRGVEVRLRLRSP